MHANSVTVPYSPPANAPRPAHLETPRDTPAAVAELEMIASIIAEIHQASVRIDNALDRLSGGRPQAVNGAGSGHPAPPANSVLSKLIIVRETLGQHLADMNDHASRIEKFV